MSKAGNAVAWAVAIANDPAHGYDQQNRWGPDYDCASLIISAWENAGVPVRQRGATYPGNMRRAFLACGFRDVTAQVNLATGAGMRPGDVLLNEAAHTAMVVGPGRIVAARMGELVVERGNRLAPVALREVEVGKGVVEILGDVGLDTPPLLVAGLNLSGYLVILVERTSAAEIYAVGEVVGVELDEEVVVAAIAPLERKETIAVAQLVHYMRLAHALAHVVVAHEVGLVAERVDALAVAADALVDKLLRNLSNLFLYSLA